ncbi:MAG: cell wall-binding repeat-containing protein [Euzebyaceae bacterium]|nr:cell wall-binding repeat-containing protein [Euzebyaceae bacterium]
MASTVIGVPRRTVVTTALVVGLLAALVVSAAPARAATGSIVFIKDNNVWIMAADDPAAARPVTTDGTADNAYSIPAQSDDGVVYAVTAGGLGDIVRMDQDGTRIGAPFRPESLAVIDGLRLSPDGAFLAVTSTESVRDGADLIRLFEVDFVHADGRDSSSLPQDLDGRHPVWYSPTGVVLVPHAELHYEIGEGLATYELGDDTHGPWFDACPDVFADCVIPGLPDVTRALDRLAVNDPRNSFGTEPALIVVYDMAGAPPAQPTRTCTFAGPEGVGNVFNVVWSPDGDALAWDLGTAGAEDTPPPAPGIYVATGFSGGDCEAAFSSAQLVVPDAGQPYWSAAPLGASPGPTEPPTEPPTDPPIVPGALVDGGRLDGGGNADPIGQAIATSRFLFGDGAASRVVLATADRFPDALAGSALAGAQGPILLTPTGGPLDQRVGEEIARVTGGDGAVLTLGGTAAVTEEAALQARAAGGDRPCAAPFPADCRYAGTGREHTAALIAATVRAEHGFSAALVARGDEFADAITGGAFAAASGVPILLTPSNQLNVDTERFLAENDISAVIVLGGTVAVDQPTFDALPGVNKGRIAGAERTATAAAIATDLWPTTGLDPAGAVLVNVRDANGWQTALSAAVASAVFHAPQVGVENPPAAIGTQAATYLAGADGPVMAFGNTALVSVDQLQQAAATGG